MSKEISLGESHHRERAGTYGDDPNSTVFVCQINTTRRKWGAKLNIEGAFEDLSVLVSLEFFT